VTGPIYVSAVNGTTNVTITYPTQTAPTIGTGAIYFYNSILPTNNTPISILGLENSTRNANRAEGFFIATVGASTATTLITYTAKGFVTANPLLQSYTIIRRGGIFNNSNAKWTNVHVASIAQSGTTVTVTMNASFPHGLIPGTPIVITGTSGGSGTNGNFFVASVNSSGYSPTVFFYTATGTATASLTITSLAMYVQPYSYINHRPFDGGVILSPNIPTHGASIVRQSKKVFRYQSGKGLLWSSGTLFCPNIDIVSATWSGNLITVTTAVPHGCPQTGATVVIKGIATSGYNGTYTVNTVTSDTTFTLVKFTSLVTPAILGDQPRLVVSLWHGASIRAGCFDDQNGLFFEYDGQTFWVVKRSSTFQLTGYVYTSVQSQVLTGVGSQFTRQLRVGDKIVIRGMTHAVTTIISDTSLYFNPPYRGSAIISSTAPVTACKVKEVRTPQTQFNRDTVDGKGPSGFNLDLTKMQMIGIQYSWYGAGSIDFMIRGGDGNWVYVHRFRQNNVNDEAYMRTGNLPVRYEVTNETAAAVSTLSVGLLSSTSATTIRLTEPTTYWPSAGTVMIDNEIVTYARKTDTTLEGGSRRASLVYNIADTGVSLKGSDESHNAGATVFLVSCSCTPSITHWGSALLIDGGFDEDRGYFFNYQVNAAGVTLGGGSTTNLFLLRLAPSVSNGIIGDIGSRDLLNRAQLLLQRLAVFAGTTTASAGSSGSAIVSGILNPQGVTPVNWIPINSNANGSQPSFAQVSAVTGNYVFGSGERVFSTICNNGQNALELSNLKEVCNGVIGGNQSFPDGPDTLLVQLNVPIGFPALNSYSVNLFWTEAQA
jgi:hypothetical protein